MCLTFSLSFQQGAVLTHTNFVSLITGHLAACMAKDRFVQLDHTEVYQSYLPLAHVFERTMELVIYYLVS